MTHLIIHQKFIFQAEHRSYQSVLCSLFDSSSIVQDILDRLDLTLNFIKLSLIHLMNETKKNQMNLILNKIQQLKYRQLSTKWSNTLNDKTEISGVEIYWVVRKLAFDRAEVKSKKKPKEIADTLTQQSPLVTHYERIFNVLFCSCILFFCMGLDEFPRPF
jgi:hypothetical protein